MAFDIFKKEQKVVDRVQQLLDNESLPEETREQLASLFKDYNKLLKTYKRTVKLSDKNEEKLNATSRERDQQNKMLEKLSDQLAKYLSPQVYDSIFSGDLGADLSTERKKLTVFFSDIVNFTLTTEDMQPEDLTGLLNSYFTEMSAIALKHGATIDKFIGDAMVMFFGDPQTLGIKEDAEACVRMGVEMQRRMVDLEQMWRKQGYEKPFKMRVGINTGYCNVGNFGSESRMDYTIIGGEVNLAARLESKAQPGGILMSHETYSLVSDVIVAEELEPIEVKGIRRDVRPYAFVGIRDELGEENALINHDQTGLSLKLALDQVRAEEREEAVQALKKALTALEKA